MPITPTYPGIYLQELSSSAHTITPSPTSVAVFIGYTHPFKTLTFGKPIELFSFSEYESNFGGFFASDVYDGQKNNFGSMAHAVYQFFLNGGSDCFVVGLAPPGAVAVGSRLSVPGPGTTGVVFTALAPTDTSHPLTLTINNVSSAGDSADITLILTYPASQQDPNGNTQVLNGAGSVFEKYRGVSLSKLLPNGQPNPNFIETVIGTATNPVSNLVTVAPAAGGYPATGLPFSAPSYSGPAYSASGAPFAGLNPPLPAAKSFPQAPAAGTNIFDPDDFTEVFAENSELDKLPTFNLLILPGVTAPGILSAASAFCEVKMAFLIIDPPIGATANGAGSIAANGAITSGPPLEKNCALYFPYIHASDPVTGATIELPPSGTVAGIFASTDLGRGVWKAPAGLATSMANSLGVAPKGKMNDHQQGVLNPLGVNCLRDFPGIGTCVFGARTLVTQNPALSNLWRYVPVRRMALFLEQTLYANLGWVVFEPNDEPLWTAIRTSIESFSVGAVSPRGFSGIQAERGLPGQMRQRYHLAG